MAGPRIYVVGTADTKGAELAYLRDRITGRGARPVVVDVGTRAPTIAVDVPASVVVKYLPADERRRVSSQDRGVAVAAMADAFARFMPAQRSCQGIVAIGGGGGTSIATAGMRAMPIGLPKIMVSTLASGDVSPYVGIADITMMPAVTDLAGLNRISRAILGNAAEAIVGMAAHPTSTTMNRPSVGMTMFGVTTECVTMIVGLLPPDLEAVVFHATGTGGRTMEALIGNGMLTSVIDITTTEIADLLVGGVLAAGQDRLDVIARTGVPYVGSVGALDMVNFWSPETVPSRFHDRLFHHHNANVTLMRTSAEECDRIGQWIGAKLNACAGPVRFLLPEKGVSALDIVGGPFRASDADEALFEAIEHTVTQTSERRIVRLPLHINDREFAEAAVAAFREINP
ncbi:MAG: Tm-1-like ATP-binding domain-containing protein [Cucumibacter sp.]